MPSLELPHTPGCFVCGPDNSHGLHLTLQVDPDTGIIQTTFTPRADHVGFQGIIHGGILATVADEAMVWSAIWSTRRSCVAAELTIRFKQKAAVDSPLLIRASVTRSHRRLIETECEFTASDGQTIATANAKYIPVSDEETAAFFKTLLDEPATTEAAALLRRPLREFADSKEITEEAEDQSAPPVLDYSAGPIDQSLVAIARFSDEFNASLASLCLESEGIQAQLEGRRDIIGVESGPIRLQVPAADADRAVEILKKTPARKFLYRLA